MMSAYRIIPIFLAGLPCPFRCIYCDAAHTTGMRHPVSLCEITQTVVDALRVCREPDTCQIGYYGNDFLSFSEKYKRDLCNLDSICSEYQQRINGIRFSTRPDSVVQNPDLISVRIKCVEIGVPSMNDSVLAACNRMHSASDVKRAVSILKSWNVQIGIQTMIGLPESDWVEAIQTAESICKLRPDFVRIHPTLVLNHADLHASYLQKSYTPLPLDEAVEWAGQLVEIYESNGIKVSRLGYHVPVDQQNQIITGPFHPSFGSLVRSRQWLKLMIERIKSDPSLNTFKVLEQDFSCAVGYKKQNVKKLAEIFRKEIKIIVSDSSNASDETLLLRSGIRTPAED